MIQDASQDSVRHFWENGYAVVDLLRDEEHERLEDVCVRRLKEIAAKELPGTAFDPRHLADYHLLPMITDDLHKRMMSPKHRRLFLDEKIQRMLANEAVWPIFQHFWGHRDVILKDELDGRWVQGSCGFRVVRPGARDVSGIHSESSYGVYPITVWIPIMGFDERYTLQLAPKSHLVKHPPEAIEQDSRFMARPYKAEYLKRFSFLRPNMKKGQAIVFHPELIHGGSDNLGDHTRVSMEVRFYPSHGN